MATYTLKSTIYTKISFSKVFKLTYIISLILFSRVVSATQNHLLSSDDSNYISHARMVCVLSACVSGSAEALYYGKTYNRYQIDFVEVEGIYEVTAVRVITRNWMELREALYFQNLSEKERMDYIISDDHNDILAMKLYLLNKYNICDSTDDFSVFNLLSKESKESVFVDTAYVLYANLFHDFFVLRKSKRNLAVVPFLLIKNHFEEITPRASFSRLDRLLLRTKLRKQVVLKKIKKITIDGCSLSSFSYPVY